MSDSLLGLATSLLPLLPIDLHPIDSLPTTASEPLFRSRPVAGYFALQDFLAVGGHRSRWTRCLLTSTARGDFAIASLAEAAWTASRAALN